MGFGSALKGAAVGGAVLGGGGALTGGLLGAGGKNLLLGKKDKGRKAGYLGLDPSLAAVVENTRKQQAKLANVFGAELASVGKVDAESAAQREMAKRISLAKQLGADQAMKTREAMARSGTQNSAVGMRALMGAENQALQGISSIRADKPQIMQEQQMNRLQRLGAISGGLGQTISTTGAPGTTRAYDPGRRGKGRSGGLLKLGLMAAGGVAGGMMGGPAGAGMGMQMGAGAGSTFANM